MTSTLKVGIVAVLCVASAGCASLKPKVVKAPCGPSAGLTDPCGNRTPINMDDYKVSPDQTIATDAVADT